MSLLVSIVVRTYDYARFLPDALDSALAQDYRPLDIVVIDDGSTDGTDAVLARYQNRCRIVRQANEGEIGAINSGFAAAMGSLVLFLDADDVLAPDAVSRAVAAWRPGVARVSFAMRVMTGNGHLLDALRPVGRNTGLDIGQQLARFGEAQSACQSANLYDATILRQLMPIDATAWPFPPDCYLNARAGLRGASVMLSAPLGGYRLHGTNFTLLNTADASRRARTATMHIRLYDILCGEAGAERWQGFGATLPTVHWFNRLISLCTVPAAHPFPDDRRLTILVECLRAIRVRQDAGPAWKLMLAAGALAITVLPAPLLSRLLPPALHLARLLRYPGLLLHRNTRHRHWRQVYRLGR